MKWIPEYPITSELSPRKSVNSFGKDLALSFDGNLVMNNGDFQMVSGKDSFVQQVKVVLLSNTNELFNFGLKHLLPETKDNFDEECHELAVTMISQENTDEYDGLGHSIESINSIEYLESSNILRINMDVTGLDQSIDIEIPVSLSMHK